MTSQGSRFLWLYSRGGRGEDDVMIDEDGDEYIATYAGRRGIKRVYLPEEFTNKFKQEQNEKIAQGK